MIPRSPLLPRSLASMAAAGLAVMAFAASPAWAAAQMIDNVEISIVAVNGATDTANPGTSCIKITPAPVAACTSGWVALPNNNRQLLASALVAKSSAAKLLLYYDDAQGSQHCPGIVFTPCAAVSIMIR